MLKLILIGFVIGIAKILPGISGSLLAIRFNIYDKLIDSIANFFKDIKKHSVFLFKLATGFLSAMIVTSKILFLIFDKYENILKILFVLLISTGIPDLIRKSKSILFVVVGSLSIFLILNSVNDLIYNCNINYFIAGIIEAFSTIIPGISGTALYINLGWYDEILELFGNIYYFDFLKIAPFGIGFMIASYFTVLFIDKIIKFNEKWFYTLISSLVIASVVLIFA